MLSQRGRYALKAMLSVARADLADRPKQVSAIASEENIPRKFLELIMSELRQADLVLSRRGKMGGYRLTRPSRDITFGDIMRVTDGPLALLPCASQNFYRRCDDCRDEAGCTLRRIMADVRNQVSDILDRTSLADAIAGDSEAMAVIDAPASG